MNSRRMVIFPLFLTVLVLLAGCKRGEEAMLDDLIAIEDDSYADRELSEDTIEELKESIEALEQEVGRTVHAGERLVTYYKMVALRYMDGEFYGIAKDFFRKALDIQPTNSLVAYRLGVCTVQGAMSQMDEDIRGRKFEEAERYYLYALQLDSKFDKVLYAISVLYIFEMDRFFDAEPYLTRLIKLESRHFSGMFLLARVYVQSGRIDDAVALYDEIIRESSNSVQVEQAEKNRDELAGGIYGL